MAVGHTLASLNAVDIRSRLPRAPWEIGRRAATTSITVHYNGPEVPLSHQSGDGLITQLIADTNWQMQKGWGGTTNGADGLQYHLVIASDGTVYQARDLDSMLWHCAHQDGNTNGLAVHLPLGGMQAPTDVQWIAVMKVLNALRMAYAVPASRVVGHIEWKHATQCPGPVVQPRVVAYRQGAGPILPPNGQSGLLRYQVISADNLNIREGPGLNPKTGQLYPVALGGKATLKPGAVIWIDDVRDGWAHMARVENEQADLGFCAVRYLRLVG